MALVPHGNQRGRLRKCPVLKSGTYAFVRFGAEPELLHERLILARIGLTGAYVIMSPDRDRYSENYESEDIIEVIAGTDKCVLPLGVGAAAGNPVYRFTAPPTASAFPPAPA